MHFNILGALEIWADQQRLRLGGPIQERVLVTLLLEPGRVVPVTRLVEAAWNEGPPATAVHQIRKAVADLRRRIPGGAGLLVTDGPGYRAAVADEQVDLSRFTRLTGEAREQFAAGPPPRPPTCCAGPSRCGAARSSRAPAAPRSPPPPPPSTNAGWPPPSSSSNSASTRAKAANLSWSYAS